MLNKLLNVLFALVVFAGITMSVYSYYYVQYPAPAGLEYIRLNLRNQSSTRWLLFSYGGVLMYLVNSYIFAVRQNKPKLHLALILMVLSVIYFVIYIDILSVAYKTVSPN